MVLDSMLWELGCVHMKLEVKLFSLKKKKKKGTMSRKRGR